MADHVKPPAEWALPDQFVKTERVLQAYDAALRLRRSIDHAGYFVLERLTINTKPVDTSAAGLTDLKMSTRDGYQHVAHVHPFFVHHPDKLLDRLLDNDNDLWKLGTGHVGSAADRYVSELRTEQDDARANRRRHRRQEWEGFYAEGFDTLDRIGDTKSHAERTRINNAGGAEPLKVTDRRRVKLEDLEPTTSAGVTPAQESSDVHPPESSRHRESGELHGQPGA
jgi:hypothetical protein